MAMAMAMAVASCVRVLAAASDYRWLLDDCVPSHQTRCVDAGRREGENWCSASRADQEHRNKRGPIPSDIGRVTTNHCVGGR